MGQSNQIPPQMAKIIQPLGSKLLVEVLKSQEETTTGGIVLAETVNAQLSKGKVLKVSPQVSERIAEGSTILFSSGSGVGQLVQNKPCVWLNESEVWGILINQD